MADPTHFDITSVRRGQSATVPCPKCGELIPGDSTSCVHCRVHLSGPARDFAPAADEAHDAGRSLRNAFKITAVGLLIVAIVVVALALATDFM